MYHLYYRLLFNPLLLQGIPTSQILQGVLIFWRSGSFHPAELEQCVIVNSSCVFCWHLCQGKGELNDLRLQQVVVLLHHFQYKCWHWGVLAFRSKGAGFHGGSLYSTRSWLVSLDLSALSCAWLNLCSLHQQSLSQRMVIVWFSWSQDWKSLGHLWYVWNYFLTVWRCTCHERIKCFFLSVHGQAVQTTVLNLHEKLHSAKKGLTLWTGSWVFL